MKTKFKVSKGKDKKKKRGRKYTFKVSITLPTGDEVCDFFDGLRRGIANTTKKRRW